MTIRKQRLRNISHSLKVDGREFLHLDVSLPNGERLQLSLHFGTVDINDHEYVAIDALFDPEAVVEYRRDMPQHAVLIIRSPKITKLYPSKIANIR